MIPKSVVKAALDAYITNANPKALRVTPDFSGGVARMVRDMPEMSPDQATELVRRRGAIEKKQAAIAVKKDAIGTVEELQGDPANLSLAAEEQPEVARAMTSAKGDADKALKSLKKQEKKAQAKDSSIKSNVLPESEGGKKEYGTQYGADIKEAQAAERGVASGDLEQHHLVPKGVTAAFLNRMDEFIASGKGKPEQLIGMVQFAKSVGLDVGDYEENILNMLKTPHNEYHTVMRYAEGLDESKSSWTKKLSKVKTPEELFELFEEWLENDAKYGKETAQVWEPLEELLEQITGIPKDKRKRFELKKSK